MQFLLVSILLLLLIFVFWMVGHLLLKTFDFNLDEDNDLLENLIKISFGVAGFLMALNFVGNITRNFYIAFIGAVLLIVFLVLREFKESKKIISDLQNIFKKISLNKLVSENKYLLALITLINVIYTSVTFSTTKLDRFAVNSGHVFNVNQFLNGIYPLQYPFFPGVAEKYHYGVDILSAILSRFSFAHPEICIDVLLLAFLNLSILTFYALTTRFLNSNNKWAALVVPFFAFLAWGPVTNLFSKAKDEVIPQKLLESIVYLSQTKITPAANWSGLVLNWFFAPPIGVGIFFFLISLYLLYRFFDGDKKISSIVVTSLFISSLIIIDFSKFVILVFGLAIYLLFSKDIEDMISKKNMEPLKNLGILLLLLLGFGILHGNWFSINKNYEPLISFYKVGTTNIDSNFSPFRSNFILIALFVYGFYKAWKLKHKWLTFLIPYFASSIVIPYIITVPEGGVGKVLISYTLLGAFAVPLAIDSIIEKLKIKPKEEVFAYSAILIIFSFSTLMYWMFGDLKPLLKAENGKPKYTGLQTYPIVDKNSEEFSFIDYIKSKGISYKTIVTEPAFSEVFTNNANLYNLFPIATIAQLPLKKDAAIMSEINFRSGFLFDKDFFNEKKVNLIYVNAWTGMFIPPASRIRMLDDYLHNAVKLGKSNKKDNPLELKELYEINPSSLQKELSNDYSALLNQFISAENVNESPAYIKRIAESPYFGVYNAMSNDFDGDKIADVAFYDNSTRKWYVVYGKDQSEKEFDLAKTLLSGVYTIPHFSKYDLYSPVPADYDGDGKTDIALFNRGVASWHLLRSSTEANDNSPIYWGGLWGELIVPADIDGDAKVEVASFVPGGTSRWPAVLTGSGKWYDMSFPATILDIPLYSDIDGDKRQDYILFRPTDGTLSVYLAGCQPELGIQGASCGAVVNAKGIELMLASPSARPVVDDYDGDGKGDIALWEPLTGEWKIIYGKSIAASEAGAGVGRTVKLGKAGDIPMPGDYNGDGKSEPAIFDIDSGELVIALDKGEKRMDLSKYKKMIPANFVGM